MNHLTKTVQLLLQLREEFAQLVMIRYTGDHPEFVHYGAGYRRGVSKCVDLINEELEKYNEAVNKIFETNAEVDKYYVEADE